MAQLTIIGLNVSILPGSQDQTNWFNNARVRKSEYRDNDAIFTNASGSYTRYSSDLFYKDTNAESSDTYRIIKRPVYLFNSDTSKLEVSESAAWSIEWRPKLVENKSGGSSTSWTLAGRPAPGYTSGYGWSTSYAPYRYTYEANVQIGPEYAARNETDVYESASARYDSRFEANNQQSWITLFTQNLPEESEAGVQAAELSGLNPALIDWRIYDGKNRPFITQKANSIIVTPKYSDNSNSVYNPTNPAFSGELFYKATPPDHVAISDTPVPLSWAWNQIPRIFFVNRDKDLNHNILTYVPPKESTLFEKPVRSKAVMQDLLGKADLGVRQNLSNNATNGDSFKRIPIYIAADETISDPIGYPFIDIPVPFRGVVGDNTLVDAYTNCPSIQELINEDEEGHDGNILYDLAPVSSSLGGYQGFPSRNSPSTLLFQQNIYCRYPNTIELKGPAIRSNGYPVANIFSKDGTIDEVAQNGDRFFPTARGHGIAGADSLEFDITLDPGSTMNASGAVQFVNKTNPQTAGGTPDNGSPYYGHWNALKRRWGHPNANLVSAADDKHAAPIIRIEFGEDSPGVSVTGVKHWDSPVRNRNSRYNGYYYRKSYDNGQPAWFKKYDLTSDTAGGSNGATQIKGPHNFKNASGASYPANATEDIRLEFNSPDGFFYLRDYDLNAASKTPYHFNDSRHSRVNLGKDNSPFTPVYRCRGYRFIPDDNSSPELLAHNFFKPLVSNNKNWVELGVPKSFSWDGKGQENASWSTFNGIGSGNFEPMDSLDLKNGFSDSRTTQSWYPSKAYEGHFNITVASGIVTNIEWESTASNNDDVAFWVGQKVKITHPSNLTGFTFYISEVRSGTDANLGNRHVEGWQGVLENGDISIDTSPTRAPAADQSPVVNVYMFKRPPKIFSSYTKNRNNILSTEQDYNYSTGKFETDNNRINWAVFIQSRDTFNRVGESRRTPAGRDFQGNLGNGLSLRSTGGNIGSNASKNNYPTDSAACGGPVFFLNYVTKQSDGSGFSKNLGLSLAHSWINKTDIFNSRGESYKFDIRARFGKIYIPYFEQETYSDTNPNTGFEEGYTEAAPIGLAYIYLILEARNKTYPDVVVDSCSAYHFLGVDKQPFSQSFNNVNVIQFPKLNIPPNRLIIGGGVNPQPGNHLGGSFPGTIKKLEIVKSGKTINKYDGTIKQSGFRLFLQKDRNVVGEVSPDNTITITCTSYIESSIGTSAKYRIEGDTGGDKVDVNDFIGLDSLEGTFVFDQTLKDSLVLTINPDKKREDIETIRISLIDDPFVFTTFDILDTSQETTFILNSSPAQNVKSFTVSNHSSPLRNGRYGLTPVSLNSNNSPNVYKNSNNYQLALEKNTRGVNGTWEWVWRDSNRADNTAIFGGQFGSSEFGQGSPKLFHPQSDYADAISINPVTFYDWNTLALNDLELTPGSFQSPHPGVSQGFADAIIEDQKFFNESFTLEGFGQTGENTSLNYFPEVTPDFEEVSYVHASVKAGLIGKGFKQLSNNVNTTYTKTQRNRYTSIDGRTEIVKPAERYEPILSQFVLTDFGSFDQTVKGFHPIFFNITRDVFVGGLFGNWIQDFIENGYNDPEWHLKYPTKEDFPRSWTIDIGPRLNSRGDAATWYPDLIKDVANDAVAFELGDIYKYFSGTPFFTKKEYIIWGLLNAPDSAPTSYNTGIIIHPDLKGPEINFDDEGYIDYRSGEYRSDNFGYTSSDWQYSMTGGFGARLSLGPGRGRGSALSSFISTNIKASLMLPTNNFHKTPSGFGIKRFNNTLIFPISNVGTSLIIDYNLLQIENVGRVYQKIDNSTYRGVPTRDELIGILGMNISELQYSKFIQEENFYYTIMSDIWQIELEFDKSEGDVDYRWVINLYTNDNNEKLNTSAAIGKNNPEGNIYGFDTFNPLNSKIKRRIYQDSNNTLTAKLISPERIIWETARSAELLERGNSDVDLSKIGKVSARFTYISHDPNRWIIRDAAWPHREYYEDSNLISETDEDLDLIQWQTTACINTVNENFSGNAGGAYQGTSLINTTDYRVKINLKDILEEQRETALYSTTRRNQSVLPYYTYRGDYYRNFVGYPQADNTFINTIYVSSKFLVNLMAEYIRYIPISRYNNISSFQLINDNSSIQIEKREIAKAPAIYGKLIPKKVKALDDLIVLNEADCPRFSVTLQTTGLADKTKVPFIISAKTADSPPRYAAAGITNEDIETTETRKVNISQAVLRNFGANDTSNTFGNVDGVYSFVQDSPFNEFIKFESTAADFSVTVNGANSTAVLSTYRITQDSPNHSPTPHRHNIIRDNYSTGSIPNKTNKEDPARNVISVEGFVGDAFRQEPPHIDVTIGSDAANFVPEEYADEHPNYPSEFPTFLNSMQPGEKVIFKTKAGADPTGTLLPFASGPFTVTERPAKNIIRIAGTNTRPTDENKSKYSARTVKHWEDKGIIRNHRGRFGYGWTDAFGLQYTNVDLQLGTRRVRLTFGRTDQPAALKDLKVGDEIKFYYQLGQATLAENVYEYPPFNNRRYQYRLGQVSQIAYKRLTPPGKENERRIVFRKGEKYLPTPTAVNTQERSRYVEELGQITRPITEIMGWEFIQLDQHFSITRYKNSRPTFTVLDKGTDWIEIAIPLESDLCIDPGTFNRNTRDQIRAPIGRHNIYPHVGMYIYKASEIIPGVDQTASQLGNAHFKFTAIDYISKTGSDAKTINFETGRRSNDAFADLFDNSIAYGRERHNTNYQSYEHLDGYKGWPTLTPSNGGGNYLLSSDKYFSAINDELHYSRWPLRVGRTGIFLTYDPQISDFNVRLWSRNHHAVYTYDPRVNISTTPIYEDESTWDVLAAPQGFELDTFGSEQAASGTIYANGIVGGFAGNFLDIYAEDELPNGNWATGIFETFDTNSFILSETAAGRTPTSTILYHQSPFSEAAKDDNLSDMTFVNTTGNDVPNPGAVISGAFTQRRDKTVRGEFEVNGSPNFADDIITFKVKKDKNFIEGDEIFQIDLENNIPDPIQFKVINDFSGLIPDSPNRIFENSPVNTYELFNKNIEWTENSPKDGVIRNAIGVLPVRDPTGGTGTRDPFVGDILDSVTLIAENDFENLVPLINLSGEYTLNTFPNVSYKYRDYNSPLERLRKSRNNEKPYRVGDIISLVEDTNDREDSPAAHLDEFSTLNGFTSYRGHIGPDEKSNTTFPVIIADKNSPDALVVIRAKGFTDDNTPTAAHNISNSTFGLARPDLYPNPIQNNFYNIEKPILNNQDRSFLLTKSNSPLWSIYEGAGINRFIDYEITNGGSFNGTYTVKSIADGSAVFVSGDNRLEFLYDERYRDINEVPATELRLKSTGFSIKKFNTEWMLVDIRDGAAPWQREYFGGTGESEPWRTEANKMWTGDVDTKVQDTYGTHNKQFQYYRWIPVNWEDFISIKDNRDTDYIEGENSRPQIFFYAVRNSNFTRMALGIRSRINYTRGNTPAILKYNSATIAESDLVRSNDVNEYNLKSLNKAGSYVSSRTLRDSYQFVVGTKPDDWFTLYFGDRSDSLNNFSKMRTSTIISYRPINLLYDSTFSENDFKTESMWDSNIQNALPPPVIPEFSRDNSPITIKTTTSKGSAILNNRLFYANPDSPDVALTDAKWYRSSDNTLATGAKIEYNTYTTADLVQDKTGYGWPPVVSSAAIWDLQKDDCPIRTVKYQLLYQIERLEGSQITNDVELIQYNQPVLNTTSEYLGKQLREYVEIAEPSPDELNSPTIISQIYNNINTTYTTGLDNNTFLGSNNGSYDILKQRYEINLVLDETGKTEDSPKRKRYEHAIRWQIKKSNLELENDYILYSAQSPTYTYFYSLQPVGDGTYELSTSESDQKITQETYDLPEDIVDIAVNTLRQEKLFISAQSPYPKSVTDDSFKAFPTNKYQWDNSPVFGSISTNVAADNCITSLILTDFSPSY